VFALAWVAVREPAEPERPATFLERLLGPVAGIAADVQWVRVDAALRRGDTAVAYARADTALRIDPGAARGWIFLAHHLVHERASIEREPDPQARARWIQTALETLARGEGLARDRGAVAFATGVTWAFLGSLPDEDRPWPASAAEAWARAAEAFERAAAAGHPLGAEAVERMRARSHDG
jgi:hypothetical protein